mmetsp:Transcript_43908/g.93419  ORF Transcript_43908/g.93419 Transcript_43908/m.93419 type:complete len:205 (+) Transcript_43908:43-657(+)
MPSRHRGQRPITSGCLSGGSKDSTSESVPDVGVVETLLHRSWRGLQHGVNRSPQAGQAVDPARDAAGPQALAEVVGEMTAVPPQQVVVVARVLLNQVGDNVRNCPLWHVRATQGDRLPVVVLRMCPRLDTRDARPCLAQRKTVGPLQAVDLDACMEDPTQLQRRPLVGKDFVDPLDALLLGNIVNVDAHWEPLGALILPEEALP